MGTGCGDQTGLREAGRAPRGPLQGVPSLAEPPCRGAPGAASRATGRFAGGEGRKCPPCLVQGWCSAKTVPPSLPSVFFPYPPSIHPPTDLSIHPLIHPFTYPSSTHSSIYPSIHLFIHLPIHHPLIYPFTHPSIHSSVYPSIQLFIHVLIIHLFIQPFIHLFIHLETNQETKQPAEE